LDDARLPLTEHLAELRTRLVRSLLAWALCTLLAWGFAEQIFRILLQPAMDALGEGGRPLQAIAPGEVFFTYLKCALLAGFVLALPVVLWQAWAFVSPGLYPSEKRWTLPLVLASTLLFVAGATLGYAVAFPLMFKFFASFDSDFVESAWTMREVFGLVTSMFLAFGAAFQIPIAVFFLAVAGVVDAKTLLRKTPYAVLAVFIVAAVLTPSPDWVSQVILGVPMVGLYLLGAGAAWLVGSRREKTTALATYPAAGTERAGTTSSSGST
jgi:sec-independent protein translocase protein TatC